MALSVLGLGAGSQANAQSRTAATAADSVGVLRTELAARFEVQPRTFDLRRGARLSIGYTDNTAPTTEASPNDVRFAADSVQFERAFDQAVWAWGRFGKRDGLDTITVRYESYADTPTELRTRTEYSFYPKQLDRPADRPVLGRQQVGYGGRDTVRTPAPGKRQARGPRVGR